MLLNGKLAVVTGAGSERGIGRAIAQAMAEHGARVAVLDLNETGARATAQTLHGDGHRAYACDVTSKASVDEAFRALVGDLGPPEILVNNAGITQPLRLLEISERDYDAVLDVNLRGTLLCSQAVVPFMRAQRGGSIVSISSVSAERGGGIFGGPHYSAAKAGILGLTKAMARELAPNGVRVNAVAPGFIDTDITGGKLTPEQNAAIVAGIPMGRVGIPADVAGCCVFLASPLAAYVTGEVIDVNGGMHMD